MKEMDEEMKQEWGLVAKVLDDAEYFFCENCQMPRTFHHPIFGITSAAGDSWSISFIK
jgi:hypothetical protein